MLAIITKYLPATDTLGGRYKAYTEAGRSITQSAKTELNGEENHTAAAAALCKKMGWKGELVSGGIERGYAFVFVARHYTEKTHRPEPIKV